MKSCTRHWWTLRLTSLPLIPLFFYFLTQMEYLAATDRDEFTGWLEKPLPAGALLVFIVCAFYHAQLGMEEIIVDYLPAPGAQRAALLANKIFFSGLGLASLYAVLAINFGKG